MTRFPAILIAIGLAITGCSGGGGDDVGPGNDSVGTGEDGIAQDGVAPGDLTGSSDQGDSGAADGTAELKSYYHLTLDLEQGTGITCTADKQVDCLSGKTCCRVVFERDITGNPTKFSFGSTHIAPAIAFAVSDTVFVPFSVVTLNFGIIIGTADKPPSTPESGEYFFTGFEPEIEVTIYNRNYSSKIEGSDGKFNITHWSADEGGLFAGTFAGKILEETAAAEKLRAVVEGDFHFILPEPQGGQPH